jgi:hypothetical protein
MLDTTAKEISKIKTNLRRMNINSYNILRTLSYITYEPQIKTENTL